MKEVVVSYVLKRRRHRRYFHAGSVRRLRIGSIVDSTCSLTSFQMLGIDSKARKLDITWTEVDQLWTWIVKALMMKNRFSLITQRRWNYELLESNKPLLRLYIEHYYFRHDKITLPHDTTCPHVTVLVKTWLETPNWKVLSLPAVFTRHCPFRRFVGSPRRWNVLPYASRKIGKDTG